MNVNQVGNLNWPVSSIQPVSIASLSLSLLKHTSILLIKVKSRGESSEITEKGQIETLDIYTWLSVERLQTSINGP